MSQEKLTARLMKTWDFDQQDLEANRSGQFTARQLFGLQQRKQQVRNTSAVGEACGLLIFPSIMVIFMVHQINRSSDVLRQLGVLVPISLGLLLLFVGVKLFQWRHGVIRRAQARNEPPQLFSVSGTVEYISTHVKGYTSYGVKVVEIHILKPSSRVWQQAFVEGETYRIYYTETIYGEMPTISELMSAEAI